MFPTQNRSQIFFFLASVVHEVRVMWQVRRLVSTANITHICSAIMTYYACKWKYVCMLLHLQHTLGN